MSKKMRFTWGILALAAAFFMAADSTANAEKLLRWKFKAGETFHFVMNQEQSQKIKSGTTPITMTTTTNMYMTMKVDSVDPQGVASITQTIDRVPAQDDLAARDLMDYDSASGKPPEGLAKLTAPVFEAMVKKPFTMKMDPQGKVSDMKLPPGFVESINNIAGGQLGNMFSEEGLKQMTGQGMAELPEKPVSKGDTWMQEMGMQLGPLGKIAVKNTSRYEGTENRDGKELDKIAIKMEMNIVPEKDKPQGIQVKMKDQKIEGTKYIDNEAGHPVEIKVGGPLKMSVAAMGQEMELEMEMSQTLRLVPSETPAKAAAPEKP